MKFLLDTCVISELIKKTPTPSVVEWLNGVDEVNLFLSILTLGELQKGVSKLSDDTRKSELQAWIENDLVARFDGRILDLDLETALVWGKMQGAAEQNGNKLPVMDSLIAASAAVRSLVVATRNTRDIERCSVKVFNPWNDSPPHREE